MKNLIYNTKNIQQGNAKKLYLTYCTKEVHYEKHIFYTLSCYYDINGTCE